MEIPRIKSPLRYPGGKTRALKQILPIIPSFKEFREPMVGGGSVFFALNQLNPECKFWINDINKELFLLWKYCKENPEELVRGVIRFKENYENGRNLYSYLLDTSNNFSDIQRAIRFFILNRITFSGLAESGGYSAKAFEGRFTDSSINRLEIASSVLKNTKVTSEDFENIINAPGEDVFLFLDPPYLSKSKSKLYGKKGELHKGFDHKRFANIMEKCQHKWLITYDDCEEIRKLFNFTPYIYKWKLQYGMNNFKQKTAAKGNELFISNYEIPALKDFQI